MGASRETNNIVLRYKLGGFKYVKSLFRGRILWILRSREFWEDNFMPLYCKLFGHTEYKTHDNESACKKCHRWLPIR